MHLYYVSIIYDGNNTTLVLYLELSQKDFLLLFSMGTKMYPVYVLQLPTQEGHKNHRTYSLGISLNDCPIKDEKKYLIALQIRTHYIHLSL